MARRPGGPLTAAIPGQNRPADQYLLGRARDFITVLAPTAGAQAAALPVSRRLQRRTGPGFPACSPGEGWAAGET